MENKNFKVGNKVWFWDFGVNQPYSGIITKIDKSVKASTLETCYYAQLQLDDCDDHCSRYLEQLFPTKEALVEFKRNNCAKYVEEYKSRIKNVNDLINFMYDYPVCADLGYCTGAAARFAAKERAKELLGIDLEY